MTEIERVYSVEEVADILHVRPRLVRSYIRNGILKAAKIGKYYRVKESNVVKLIENGNND